MLMLEDANPVSTRGEDPKKEREREESQLLEGDKIHCIQAACSTCKLHGAGPAGHTVCGQRTVQADGNANSGSMKAIEAIGAKS